MNNLNKKIMFGMIFLMVILSIGFVFAQSAFSNPQFTIPGSATSNFFKGQNIPSFNDNMCGKGQDFIVQVAPFGCDPITVRSDLLEEQNVPVFCQLRATQINPLISVDAIKSMTFKGQYPKEVSGVGFYPARAAIKSGSSTLLNSPVLGNIGYAVIVLKQHEKEADMPDSVGGNLIATIKYDIENAFGIGKATYYLPGLNDFEWGERYEQYGFWNGKGFLRAEGIDNNEATISVYTDENNKIGSFDLKKGQTSNPIYLPGFYCAANLKVRLDGLEAPDTRAKLNINGDIIEVADDQRFLGNACQVKDIEKNGVNQEVEISCRTDEGTDKFKLKITPKIKLVVDGKPMEVKVGDKLYNIDSEEKSVYLGYVGESKEGVNFIFPVLSTAHTSDEFRKTQIYKRLPLVVDSIKYDTGNPVLNGLKHFYGSAYGGIGSLGNYLATGDIPLDWVYQEGYEDKVKEKSALNGGAFSVALNAAKAITVDFYSNLYNGVYEIISKIKGFKTVKFIGFAEPGNKPFDSINKKCISDDEFEPEKCETGDWVEFFDSKDDSFVVTKKSDSKWYYNDVIYTGKGLKEYFDIGDVKDYGFSETNSEQKLYYDNAMKDYKLIIDKFPSDIANQVTKQTFAEQALIKAIDLAEKTNQRKTMKDLCQTFRERFSDSKEKLPKCDDALKLLNFGIPNHGVSINGKTKEISFEGIYEPSFEEHSAEIFIRMPDGKTQFFNLRKNQIIYLSELAEVKDIDKIFQVIQGRETIYFKFDGIWKWSQYSDKNFEDVKKRLVDVAGGASIGGAVIKNEDNFLLIEKLFDVKDNFNSGKEIILNKGGTTIKGNEFIQLLSLDKDSARLNVNLKAESLTDKIVKATVSSSRKTLKKDEGNTFGSKYTFTLTKINLKNVAKVTVLPGVENAGTEANVSFNIGIEKRGIQLSPEEIQDRLQTLDASIEKWEGHSDSLGNVVRGFNAACLATGTALTFKNFFGNLDGKAIARKEVMRSDGGYMDICKEEIKKTGDSIDGCLLEHNDDIEDAVENRLQAMQGTSITEDTLCNELTNLNLGKKIVNPKDKKELELGDITSTFTPDDKDNKKCEKIRLSDARDLRTIKNELALTSNQDRKDVLNFQKYQILKGIDDEVKGYQAYLKAQEALAKNGLPNMQFASPGVSKDSRAPARYHGYVSKGEFIQIPREKEFQPVRHIDGNQYIITLRSAGRDSVYTPEEVFKIELNGGLTKVSDPEAGKIKGIFSSFKKYDSASYNNQILNPEVKYFEREPYKGFPALVPIDIIKGWYVETKQTLGGYGNIQSFDKSGRVTSFWLCNVGENGKVDGTDKDDCQMFNPGTGTIASTFPGLERGETNKLVGCAINTIGDAQKAYKSNVRSVNINTRCGNLRSVKVGSPAIDIPEVQCQDFMSPKECLILFNACDPVVCPSSRCNLGGTYHVADVVQSGIAGSALLCLPNIKEDIYVPICLSGIKAGMDSWISVQKNYRSCLQENLDTGKTIGICDEFHSIYICDFFWNQAGAITQVAIPKIFEWMTGQGSRGGGEYLGFQSAFDSAGDSVDYMTQYYGANSFDAFKTQATEGIGKAICKNFVSATYPSDIGLGSLIEPRSPPQYSAWFSEQTFTTATVPATSQYKVFYHIYAGENSVQNVGAYYTVFLKSPSGTSFYQTNPTYTVANGYIAKGDFASETKDFTAPTGYKELCIRVNAQEQCGFKQVSTEFGLNYLNDKYMQEQASDTNIDSESTCISGTPSAYSLLNPNLQAGASEIANPELYNRGIVRVCSTANPGQGTDPGAGTKAGRWQEVGTCDGPSGKIKCYLDSKSVKEVIKSIDIESQTLGAVSEKLDEMLADKTTIAEKDIASFKDKSPNEIIAKITDAFIEKAILTKHRAELLLIRANAYFELVTKRISLKAPVPKDIDPVKDAGGEEEWGDWVGGENIDPVKDAGGEEEWGDWVGGDIEDRKATEATKKEEATGVGAKSCSDCTKNLLCDKNECKEISESCVYTRGTFNWMPDFGTCREGVDISLPPPTSKVNEDLADPNVIIRLNSYNEIIRGTDNDGASQKYNVPENLIKAIILQESTADENALGPDGNSFGLMQVTIIAAKDVEKNFNVDGDSYSAYLTNELRNFFKDNYDKKANIHVGTAYYKRWSNFYSSKDNSGENLKKITLASYNWGSKSIQNNCKDNLWINCKNIPPIVLKYISNVIAYEKYFNGQSNEVTSAAEESTESSSGILGVSIENDDMVIISGEIDSVTIKDDGVIVEKEEDSGEKLYEGISEVIIKSGATLDFAGAYMKGGTINIKSGATVDGIGVEMSEGTINIESGAVISGSVGNLMSGGIINIESEAVISGSVGILMSGGTINIELGATVEDIGRGMSEGTINIESGAVISGSVGILMKGGTINIESGAIVDGVGFFMKGGTINIKSGAIVDSVNSIGYMMKGGTINIEPGVIDNSRGRYSIDRESDMKGSKAIYQSSIDEGWIKFVGN